MQESMYKNMKVGIIHFASYPEVMNGKGPILETLQKIAEDDFYTAVEVTWMKDPEVRKKAKDLLEASRLAVAYGAQPRLLINKLDINSFNEEERQRAIEQVKEGIDEAYELGAKGLGFLSGKDPGEKMREEALKLLIASTKEICSYAQSKGDLKISLEVFDYDIAKKCLIGPVELARSYAEEVRQEFDNFGLMVDLSHIPLLRESIQESILPVKDYIIHAHIGNCIMKDKNQVGYGDEHPRFGVKGGENDVAELAEYLRVLLDIGYLNPENPPFLSFEVKPLPGESPEVIIANTKRTLKEAWARI